MNAATHSHSRPASSPGSGPTSRPGSRRVRDEAKDGLAVLLFSAITSVALTALVVALMALAS